MMSHSVKIYDTCIGCTQCVRACPTDVLEMVPWGGCRAGQIASAPRTEDCACAWPGRTLSFRGLRVSIRPQAWAASAASPPAPPISCPCGCTWARRRVPQRARLRYRCRLARSRARTDHPLYGPGLLSAGLRRRCSCGETRRRWLLRLVKRFVTALLRRASRPPPSSRTEDHTSNITPHFVCPPLSFRRPARPPPHALDAAQLPLCGSSSRLFLVPCPFLHARLQLLLHYQTSLGVRLLPGRAAHAVR